MDLRQIKIEFNNAYDSAWKEIASGDAVEAEQYIKIAQNIVEVAEHMGTIDIQTMKSQLRLVSRGLATIT